MKKQKAENEKYTQKYNFRKKEIIIKKRKAKEEKQEKTKTKADFKK